MRGSRGPGTWHGAVSQRLEAPSCGVESGARNARCVRETTSSSPQWSRANCRGDLCSGFTPGGYPAASSEASFPKCLLSLEDCLGPPGGREAALAVSAPLSPHLTETSDWTFSWVPFLPCSFAPMFVELLTKVFGSPKFSSKLDPIKNYQSVSETVLYYSGY